MLIGSYFHQLDQKNRFRIPAKLKAALGEEMIITKGANHSLYILSKNSVEVNIFNKMQNISMFDESVQKSFRLLLSSAHEVEIDQQGRILMPTALKSYAKIEKNIVFIGVGDRVEIWAEEEWIKYSSGLDFDKEMDSLAKSGV